MIDTTIHGIVVKITVYDKFQLNILKDEIELSRGEIDKKLGFNKSKTLRIINNLVDKNIVQKLGKGPGTTYRPVFVK